MSELITPPAEAPKKAATAPRREAGKRPPVARRVRSRVAALLGDRVLLTLRCAAILVTAGLIGTFVNHLATAEKFHLTEVKVIGAERLSPQFVTDYVAREAALEPGLHMFALPISNAEADLKRIPVLADAHVRRYWPNRVEVHLSEREGAGIFVSTNGSYLFDKDGLIFTQATAEDFRTVEGPLLTGWNNLHPDHGVRLPELSFRRAMRDLAVIRKASPNLWKSISEFRWDDEGGAELVMERGQVIHYGHTAIADAGPILETIMNEDQLNRSLARVTIGREGYVALQRRIQDSNAGGVLAAAGRH